MIDVDHDGYLSRTERGHRNPGAKGSKRNWWLVKNGSNRARPSIVIKAIYLPHELIGKRVRFKLEIIQDEKTIARENK